MEGSLNWLYDSCANWLDAKHKTDFHARDDRLKLVAAANDKGLTVEQVSSTIHQINEDRRNAKRITEDANDSGSELVTEEVTDSAPAQQQQVCPSTSKGKTSASGTRISGASGGKSIVDGIL